MDGSPAPRRGPRLATRMTRGGVLLAIGFYQNYLRLHLFGTCRFHPTCSVYAQECVSRFGVCRGGYLAIRRILRCRPFGRSGFDPVPER